MTSEAQPTALITGASRGLGRALAHALDARGWSLILTARHTEGLAGAFPDATVVRGDVTDARHRADLAAAVDQLELLVNNASELGPSPLPLLTTYPLDALRSVLETNVLAPIGLVQVLAPALRRARGTVLNLSSDAAVQAYPGWGGYGSAKAALDHASAVLAVEEPDLHVYAIDPGDMRTAMHQAAFPGEDISDRPEPETVVPHLLGLIDLARTDRRPPGGRYRAADLAVAGVSR